MGIPTAAPCSALLNRNEHFNELAHNTLSWPMLAHEIPLFLASFKLADANLDRTWGQAETRTGDGTWGQAGIVQTRPTCAHPSSRRRRTPSCAPCSAWIPPIRRCPAAWHLPLPLRRGGRHHDRARPRRLRPAPRRADPGPSAPCARTIAGASESSAPDRLSPDG